MLIGGAIGLILAIGLFEGKADPGLCVVGLLFLGCLGAAASEGKEISFMGVIVLLIAIPTLIYFLINDEDEY